MTKVETNSNTESATLPTAIPTKLFQARYNFKTTKANSDAHKVLVALTEEGKLAQGAVKEVKDGEELVGYKREQFVKDLEVVDIAQILVPDSLSPAQINHLQYLVEKGVEAANKEVVNECGTEFKAWDAVLSASPISRKGSAKITLEMVTDAAKAFIAYLMENTKATDAALELVERLAMKKFSVSACNKQKLDVLEKIQGMIAAFAESLEEEGELATYEAVLLTWASELEKTLDPDEEELTVDMFG